MRTILILFLTLSSIRPLFGTEQWQIREVFSNSDGRVQFIELYSPAFNQNALSTLTIRVNEQVIQPTIDTLGGTRNKHFLLATASFESETNGIVPDFILPERTIPTSGVITIQIGTRTTRTFTNLPLDGIFSVNAASEQFLNSPTNFAGEVGALRLNSSVGQYHCDSGDLEFFVSTSAGNVFFVILETITTEPFEVEFAQATPQTKGTATGASYSDAEGLHLDFLSADCLESNSLYDADFEISNADPLRFQLTSVDLLVQEQQDIKILEEGTSEGAWPNYSGNLSSNKYSPLDQIHKQNVNEVEILWRWRSLDNDIVGPVNSAFESTPLMIDGVLYTSTSFSQVAAIDALTGITLWTFDPQSYKFGRPPNNGFLHRGVAWWEKRDLRENTRTKRLYIATGDARLIAINPDTGLPVYNFGNNGIVDLLDGVPRQNASSLVLDQAHDQLGIPELAGTPIQIGNTSPPIICRDVVIVGSSIHDGEVLPPSPPGDVKGFSALTGELLWTFHTIPRAGEFGTETWENESWSRNGGANVWAPMSADEELGQVYLPVSCPTNNYYGGQRPGDNLFANSVVSLDCETGKRNWHYQTVHHDIWDYDLPAAPNLMDITVDGIQIQALAQVSKQGYVYVLDRVTGEPVWPIVETPVIPSQVPGEIAASTQPIPSKPPPFERQGVELAALWNPSSVDPYVAGPLYTPPSTQGTIITPGEGGGANWGGASFDPETQTLYVSSLGPFTYLIQLFRANVNFYYARPEFFQGHGSPYIGPLGTITSYDMNEGTVNWQVPNTEFGGVVGTASSMVTKSLLIYGNRSLQELRFFDKENGNFLSSVSLPASVSGVPMTFQIGDRQIIVVAVGKGTETTELVALGLP
ncbi:MAG: hypothetical protein NZ837_10855 [Gammaproteobacteria bacterium]|nr:hypothetical protein [Gammaproteobacteria bacterium]